MKYIVMEDNPSRFKNGRPKRCPICLGTLSRVDFVDGLWECHGLATPSHNDLPLCECPYFYDENDGSEFDLSQCKVKMKGGE